MVLHSVPGRPVQEVVPTHGRATHGSVDTPSARVRSGRGQQLSPTSQHPDEELRNRWVNFYSRIRSIRTARGRIKDSQLRLIRIRIIGIFAQFVCI